MFETQRCTALSETFLDTLNLTFLPGMAGSNYARIHGRVTWRGCGHTYKQNIKYK